MNNPTNDTMPDEIFAYRSTTGINAATGEEVECGYHGTGTWIDFDDSCPGDEAEPYVRKNIVTPEAAKAAMRMMASLDFGGMPEFVEYQETIVSLLRAHGGES